MKDLKARGIKTEIMKIKNFINLLVASIGLTCLVQPNLIKRVAIEATDPFFSTHEERKIEERIGKPLYFRFSDNKALRNKKALRFQDQCEYSRMHWDNFYEQFSKVHGVFAFYDRGSEVGGAADGRCITINKSSASVLIHELAHVWHLCLPNYIEFCDKWRKISGGKYLGKNYRMASNVDIINLGAVSEYACKNLSEDIAGTIDLVYRLTLPLHKNQHYDQSSEIDLPDHLIHQIAPKVHSKMALLRDNNFISQREYNYSSNRLALYLKQR